jgi:hypothetical protein
MLGLLDEWPFATLHKCKKKERRKKWNHKYLQNQIENTMDD